ncbi:MAG: MATE family efflux transporter [Acidobacteria bacterium]|nr:MATE family efflux transporter [Acidobacteriota bacterium]
MRDLTRGSILGHLLHMAMFMSLSMALQTLYILVDLYFVSSLGKEAVAALSLAGNLQLTAMALTQMLGAGTTTLIAHATGRGDHAEARTVFHQAWLLSAILGLAVFVFGFALRMPYSRALSADETTVRLAGDYLIWFLPSLALQFPMVAMGSALRGRGVVKPGLAVQAISVGLNTILAPVLIAGWGTGHPLGVTGAGIATFLALAAGVAAMTIYMSRIQRDLTLTSAIGAPRFDLWRRMLNIGLPAGGEFALISISGAAVYWIIRDFGASAQAGYGIGGRLMQSIFLPVMAIAFAAGPVAGQNFGARQGDRVREAYRTSAWLGAALMTVTTLLCRIMPARLIAIFTSDAGVVSMGAEYLSIVAWNFVAAGLNFTASGMFQALGNAWPSLACSAARLALFLAPALWMATQPDFALRQLWYWAVASVALQAVASYFLLQREFRRKGI